MKRPYTMFLLLVCSALSLNAFVAFGYEGWHYSVFLSVCYFMACYLRPMVWDQKLSDLPQKLRDFQEKPRWLFFFGRISSDKGDIEKILGRLAKNLSRSVVIWMQMLVIFWYIFWGYYFMAVLGLEFAPMYLPFAWVSWLILRSYHQKQFLILWSVSVALSLLTLANIKMEESWMLFPNLVLYLMALTVFRKFRRSTNSPESRLAAVVLATAFIGSMTLIAHSFLDKLKWEKNPEISHPSVRERLSQRIAEKAIEYSEEHASHRPRGDRGSSSGGRQGSGKPTNSPEPSPGGGGQSSAGSGHGSQPRSGGGESKMDMEKLSRQLSQMEKQIQQRSQSPSGGGGSEMNRPKGGSFDDQLSEKGSGSSQQEMNPQQAQRKIEQLQEQLQKMDPKQMDQQMQQMKEQLKEMNHRVARQNSQQGDGHGQGEGQGTGTGQGSGDGSGSGDSRTADKGGAGQNGGGGSQADQGSMKSAKSFEKDMARELKDKRNTTKKKIDELKRKIDSVMSLLEKAFKAALVLFVMFLIYKVWNWNRKRDPDKIERKPPGLSESDRKILNSKYRALMARKLSPEEEVSETYSLFLQSMYLIEYPKELWMTASDYQKQLELDYSSLRKCSKTITEVYCDTYYGEKPVLSESLTELRTARDQLIRLVA